MHHQPVEDLKLIFNKSIEGHPLNPSEMCELILAVMDGQLSDVKTAALLTSLKLRGESPNELAGCAQALMQCCTKLPHNLPVVLDTCGTGGDHLSTFNISTATAFVVAASGLSVAKHGNRAASGKTGSADVLEALGINLNLRPSEALQSLIDHQLCFLFAPHYHPSLAKVAKLRTDLGFKTIFNLVGPLVNPVNPNIQLIGTPDMKTAELMATALAADPHKKALVVVGHGGMDELSTTGDNHIIHVENGTRTTTVLSPEAVGLTLSTLEQIKGHDAAYNAALLNDILNGHEGAATDVVLLNAGAALYLAAKAADVQQGIHLARKTLQSGKAAQLLKHMQQGGAA